MFIGSRPDNLNYCGQRYRAFRDVSLPAGVSGTQAGKTTVVVTLRHGLNPHCRALSGYQWQQYCIWLFYSYFGQAEPLFWIKMNLLKKFIEQRVEVDRNKIRWNSPTIRPHFDTSRKSLYLWPQRFILSGRLNVTWIFVIKCYFCAQHNYHSDWPKICYFNYN